MKRIFPLGLCLIFCLTAVVPAFSQGGENNAWQAIQDEPDARRKAEKLSSFIGSYQSSSHRPDADKMLINYYVENKDNAKIMQHADSFRLNLPSADNASKAFVYTQAMMAALTLNNAQKLGEFANYALTADPNNLQVLGVMARLSLPNPAAALEHAKKAVAVPRPVGMSDAQYDALMGALHGVIGNAYFGDKKLKEAGEEFTLSLKANPKDHTLQFRQGVVSLNLMAQAVQNAVDANEELIKAMAATPRAIAAEVDATAKRDAASKEALEHSDRAMESLGKAVAIGGPFLKDAKQLLDNIFKTKKGSLDGQEQYLAEKKKELGI